MLPYREDRIKLIYLTEGSYGQIFLDKNKEYVYKITSFQHDKYIDIDNLIELLYLNYFKKKYKNLYDKLEENDFLPIQSVESKIINFIDFNNLYEIENCSYKNQDNNYIILNKLKYYKNNLFELIKNNPSNIFYDIDFIAKNIIKSLYIINTNNLLHGDIKSYNIVYDYNQCKLIDFGGLKPLYSNDYICTCTSTYRCPEDLMYENNQINNYKNSDIKSDIWSLGIILLEILIGYNPVNQIYNIYLNKIKDNRNNNLNTQEKNKKAEKMLCDTFMNDDYIDVNAYYKSKYNKNYNLTNIDSCIINDSIRQLENKNINYVTVIESMLQVNPDNRISSLEEIYKKLFNEELIIPEIFNTNNDYNYETLLNNIKNENTKNNFKNFRNNNYKIIIDFINKYLDKHISLLTLNILDKYYINLINNIENINEIIFLIHSNIYKNYLLVITMVAAISISNCIIFRQVLDIHKINNQIFEFDLIKSSSIKYITKTMLTDEIINILVILNYDIIDINLDNHNIKNKISDSELDILINEYITNFSININKL